MARRDLSYIMRERKRRADPDCVCGGDGCDPADGGPCFCIMRSGDYREAPDPLADEGQSDARELARDR